MEIKQETNKNKTTVQMLNYTPLWVCSDAIRECWASGDLSDTTNGVVGQKDKELIARVGVKFKHASTMEHLAYNYRLDGISRALLQELARHRMASPSVKSTRYTLKELKTEEPFITNRGVYDGVYKEGDYNFERAEKYLVFTADTYVDMASIDALEKLRTIIFHGITNDRAKFCMPEAYRTSLAFTINARSLRNFLSLRTSKAALWEIRELAQTMFNVLPEEHKYLFEDCVEV